MLTAMLAVDNIQGARHDLWQVNAEQEYHEETSSREADAKAQLGQLADTQPQVPQPMTSAVNQRLVLTFAKLDKLAFATAMGTVTGLIVAIATLWIAVKGGERAGQNLQMLGQFFQGYTVTVSGALIGLVYSFASAFLWGWLFAYLRNFALGFLIYRVRREAELMSFRQFLDRF